jgi:hypothetical protein
MQNFSKAKKNIYRKNKNKIQKKYKKSGPSRGRSGDLGGYRGAVAQDFGGHGKMCNNSYQI